MHLRITRMQFLIGFLLIFFWSESSVNCQTATSCIKCDSANEEEKECGFVLLSSTLGLAVEECAEPLNGCFTQLYLIEDNAYPGNYTRRGCRTNGDVCSADESSCVLCDTNNCNSALIPTNRPKCLKCSGDSCASPTRDLHCAVYLEGSPDCVTVFDSDAKVIQRDCYADVIDVLREQCSNENYLDCKACSGENCNTVSDREGRKCHKCEGAECLNIDSTRYLEDCRSSCYIGINSNGEPVRGCSSDFENTNLCSRNEDSTSDCFVCDIDGCNAILYPMTGRLRCHTCSSGDCEPSEDNLQYCASYSKDEGCASIFSTTQDLVETRGCFSSLTTEQKTFCNSDSSNCFKCSYDKCNKDYTKLKTDFCIECDSSTNSDCVKENPIYEVRCSTNQCYTRLLSAESNVLGRSLARGCSADLTTSCASPDCVACTGKNCNKQIFPETRISCKSCAGDECKNNGGVDKICNHYISDESCVTFFSDLHEVSFRDCYADAANGTRQICDDESEIQCTKCKGNLCNIDTQRRGRKCFKCEGLECAGDMSNVVDCLSDCYVGVNANGEAKRDCASEIINSTLTCGKSDLTCSTCNEDYCNAITFPTQGRLSCIKCLGQDCVDLNTKSEYCERWSSTEKCVSLFNQNGIIAERGCSSTIQNSATCTTSNCLSCSFDNCNVAISLNETFTCVSCKSEDNVNCISNPNATAIIGCTNDQCYSRLLTSNGVGQHIERGCSVGAQCTTSTCSLCNGERCNSKVYPTDRHSCYQCSGENCSGLLREKLCTLYSQNKNCVTFFGTANEVIYRDCYIDAASGTKNVCSNSSDLNCSNCSGKLCNKDVKRRGTRCLKCEGLECFNGDYPANSIDCLSGGCYVGVNAVGYTKRDCSNSVSSTASCALNDTQTANCLVCQGDYCNAISYPMRNRLICKECRGESCVENVLDEKNCENFSQTERCVSVFTSQGVISERGCSSTVQSASVCNGTDSRCLKCSFNSCNVQNSQQELYHCMSCNSLDDPNCFKNSSSVATKSCTTNQCFSRLLTVSAGSPWQYVIKGCVSDLPTTFNCTGNSCSSCTGDRCNNILYPSNRLTCLSCRNDECKQENVTSKTCELYNGNRQGCVTLYDTNNEVSYRGCYSDVANGTRQVCDDPSQLLCTKCTTSDCNRDTVRRGKKCFKCQGLGCFTPEYPADVVDCLSNCYTGINERGENVRDCASAFINTTACGDDNGVSRCNVCTDDLCNAISFPLVNRLECHTCMGENCAASDDNLAFCERFHQQERCVTVLSKEDDKVVERGCTSSISNLRYCNQNYENCLQCPTRGCNIVNSRNDRLCVDCNSRNDPNCIQDPSRVTTSKTCALGCYTRLVNGTLFRGCSDDLSESFECSSDNNCQHCNDIDKCNTINYPSDRRSCRTCNGTANCTTPTSSLCLNYKQNDSCVTLFTDYSVSSKGCLSDLSSVNQAICSNASNSICTACSTRNNCNTDTVRRNEQCLVCSSALEPKCSQRPSEVVAEHCGVPSGGRCFTRIQAGATIRGCMGSLTSGQCINQTESALRPASLCVINSGPGTNNKIIPIERQKCYHCDSRIDETCLDGPTNSTPTLPCISYVRPEMCLKLNLNDGSVVRGCESDFSSDICQLGSCFKCNNKDGCNKASLQSVNLSLAALSLLILLCSLFKSSSLTTWK